MKKIMSFMHISLDGFVAGLNGEMDWISINQEIFDYIGKRIQKGDTAIYGRKTFEMMEHYWPKAGEKPNASKHDIEHSKWYNHAHKVVISKTLKEETQSKVSIIKEDILEKVRELKQSPGDEILVFGSPSTTHFLIEQNLIDGYWLFISPILLGEGIPLFKNIDERTKLKLLSTHTFDCGVVEMNYMVDRD